MNIDTLIHQILADPTNGVKDLYRQYWIWREDNRKRNEKYQDEIRSRDGAISSLIGYKYPARAIVEFALETQEGPILNLERAKLEFNLKNESPEVYDQIKE